MDASTRKRRQSLRLPVWSGLVVSPRLICPPLQCSASCGPGYRQRLVSCSEVHVENENYEYSHQSLSSCPGTPPESYMPCDLEPCPPPLEWRVGIWGPVSARHKKPSFISFSSSTGSQKNAPQTWSTESHSSVLTNQTQSTNLFTLTLIY